MHNCHRSSCRFAKLEPTNTWFRTCKSGVYIHFTIQFAIYITIYSVYWLQIIIRATKFHRTFVCPLCSMKGWFRDSIFSGVRSFCTLHTCATEWQPSFNVFCIYANRPVSPHPPTRFVYKKNVNHIFFYPFIVCQRRLTGGAIKRIIIFLTSIYLFRAGKKIANIVCALTLVSARMFDGQPFSGVRDMEFVSILNSIYFHHHTSI